MGSSASRQTLISQIPALQLLTALGYRYLTPVEALALRGNTKREVGNEVAGAYHVLGGANVNARKGNRAAC